MSYYTKNFPFIDKRDIVSTPLYDDDTITQLVDQILQLMDRNVDGFVDYGEYRLFSGNNK